MQDTHRTHAPAWDRLRSLVLAPASPSPSELPYEREQQVGAGIARKSDWCRVLRLEVVRSNDTSNIEAEVDGRARTPGSRQTHYSIMKLCAFARAVCVASVRRVARRAGREWRQRQGGGVECAALLAEEEISWATGAEHEAARASAPSPKDGRLAVSVNERRRAQRNFTTRLTRTGTAAPRRGRGPRSSPARSRAPTPR